MRDWARSYMGPLFVAVGYGLIVGIAFVHFTKFLPAHSLPHCLLSVFLASELLVQYSLAIWSDPGFVQLEHVADFSSHETEERFCSECVRVKPLRAHHCRECRRCVFEMDHHCPWINNCVGYYNYRHFWLLLMYIWLSCLYVAMLSARLFLATFSSEDKTGRREGAVLDRFKVLFSFMATSVVGVILCCYWGWHVYLVLSEQTTIEFMQREGERIRLSVTAAAVKHALGRMLGRQDNLWFVAFVLPPLQQRRPPKYLLKPSSLESVSAVK
ncbi:Palmitoyltransferase zdhhc15 [Phytophthora boehmeriae]|uniref:Palmitoyltransferase n=1 Tax=Phytophthora boehmeriae TaxID=109152 RepID=A0A8T1WZZ5_9STRA|nr:Palmitoyltransferase zdhhc15 [Phytophthora boehmeriae]